MKAKQIVTQEAISLPEWALKPPTFPTRDSSGDPKTVADIRPLLGPTYLETYNLTNGEPQASAA